MIQFKNILSHMVNVTIDNSVVLRRYYVAEPGPQLLPKHDSSDVTMDKFCKLFKFRYCPLEGITQTIDVKAHLECVDLCRDSRLFGWLTRLLPHKQWFLVVRFCTPVGTRQVKILDYPLDHYMSLQDAYKSFVMNVNEKKFL